MTFAIAERSGILVRSRADEEPANAGAESRSGAGSTLVRAAVAVLISPLTSDGDFYLRHAFLLEP